MVVSLYSERSITGVPVYLVPPVSCPQGQDIMWNLVLGGQDTMWYLVPPLRLFCPRGQIL